jgi:hypothetical protein
MEKMNKVRGDQEREGNENGSAFIGCLETSDREQKLGRLNCAANAQTQVL